MASIGLRQWQCALFCQVLINAVTGHVGPGTQVTGYPTNQDFDSDVLNRSVAPRGFSSGRTLQLFEKTARQVFDLEPKKLKFR